MFYYNFFNKSTGKFITKFNMAYHRLSVNKYNNYKYYDYNSVWEAHKCNGKTIEQISGTLLEATTKLSREGVIPEELFFSLPYKSYSPSTFLWSLNKVKKEFLQHKKDIVVSVYIE